MNIIEKSESIRAGLCKGFQDGTSKLAQRRCYGYDIGPDGGLVTNPAETAIVRRIFDRYISGDSLGKIAAGLEEQCIPTPTGKPRWNREAISKLILNEKYTGRVLLQKTISAGGYKVKSNGFVDQHLYADSHEAIISDEMFRAVTRKGNHTDYRLLPRLCRKLCQSSKPKKRFYGKRSSKTGAIFVITHLI